MARPPARVAPGAGYGRPPAPRATHQRQARAKGGPTSGMPTTVVATAAPTGVHSRSAAGRSTPTLAGPFSQNSPAFLALSAAPLGAVRSTANR